MSDPCLKCAALGAFIGICAMGAAWSARADGTPTPFDQFTAAICPQPGLTAYQRAPQFWQGEPITYGPYSPDPVRGLIEHPGLGTGGSGGHSPEPELPAPVSLGTAAAYLGGGVGLLGALAFARRRRAG